MSTSDDNAGTVAQPLAEPALRVVGGNLAIKPRGRGPGRPWPKGVSGNPSGCPKDGSPRARPGNKIAKMNAMALRKGKSVFRVVIAQALAGNVDAAQLVLERAYPRERSRVELPKITDTASAMKALTVLMDCVAAGTISAADAYKLSALARRFISLAATKEQEEKIAALETLVKQRGVR